MPLYLHLDLMPRHNTIIILQIMFNLPQLRLFLVIGIATVKGHWRKSENRPKSTPLLKSSVLSVIRTFLNDFQIQCLNNMLCLKDLCIYKDVLLPKLFKLYSDLKLSFKEYDWLNPKLFFSCHQSETWRNCLRFDKSIIYPLLVLKVKKQKSKI